MLRSDLDALLDQPKAFDTILASRDRTRDCLIAAAKFDYGALIQGFLANTVNMQAIRDDRHRTALHHASRHGNLSIVQEILQYDGILLYAVDKFGKTALHSAVRGQHLDVTAFLLDAGADANQISKVLRISASLRWNAFDRGNMCGKSKHMF
eukprot:TRINITY_DN12371_c0_g1_i16.p1 TRINITY_DN12371_c0_g1~~TRINITY_DN12371_c0_g1_i16.p1  ORF type:complete len:152 (+),score=16.22 TRINITY_DN12371_c0_g1_i16:88-543(+)